MKQKSTNIGSNAENIADEARESISKFCYEECKSYCCRKGYLGLDKSNVSLVTQGREAELEQNKTLLKKSEDTYSLNIGKDSCPSLKEYKCTIHTNSNRPSACKKFPIFIDGDILKVSPKCLAVRDGKLYPFISRILNKGYELSKINEYGDFDFDSGIKMLDSNKLIRQQKH